MKGNRKTLEKNQWSQKLILWLYGSDVGIDIDQQYRIESTEKKPFHYDHFIFNKEAKTMVNE